MKVSCRPLLSGAVRLRVCPRHPPAPRPSSESPSHLPLRSCFPARWVGPQAERPRFPGPLLITRECRRNSRGQRGSLPQTSLMVTWLWRGAPYLCCWRVAHPRRAGAWLTLKTLLCSVSASCCLLVCSLWSPFLPSSGRSGLRGECPAGQDRGKEEHVHRHPILDGP